MSEETRTNVHIQRYIDRMNRINAIERALEIVSTVNLKTDHEVFTVPIGPETYEKFRLAKKFEARQLHAEVSIFLKNYAPNEIMRNVGDLARIVRFIEANK